MNTVLKKKTEMIPDKEYVRRVSEELKLHPRLVELLFSRGIQGKDAINSFLNPDIAGLCNPFLMKGMQEAVTRVRQAIEDGETIIVYGDYDADGVCASAILSLCFKSMGADVIVHIPSRVNDGYGLNVNSIERLIEEHNPDLIVTCDCGISGIEEVEHCRDLGVDIIVTDHHEPGNRLPDCIVVNPKQNGDEYPDKYLCGAGVALKFVQAFTGDDMYKEFLDIAAVATIADLVPLLNENRLIVQLGLKTMASGKFNFGLKLLLKSQGLGSAVTSTDIAYKIAPRINAAGRMGDAYRAFEILTSPDEKKITSLISEIDDDNERRKELCDTIYEEAVADLAYENLTDNRAIILCNPEWAKGVTGIAAARLSAEYNRPTFIIVDKNDEGIYKGTARGIKNVNIFEALSYCSDLLTEFGGHTGAAGFSLKEENIPAFKNRMNEYLSALPEEYFLPYAEYDLEVSVAECNSSLLNALQLIEPTGNSNTRPLLKIVSDNIRISPCRNPVHTSVQIGQLQTYAFNFYNKNQFLIGNGNKDIVLELSEGLNGGVSGYVKAVGTQVPCINDENAKANFIGYSALFGNTDKAVFKRYDREMLADLLPSSVYGTLFICADSVSLKKILGLNGKFVTCDYMTKSEANNYSGIIVSPDLYNVELKNYSRIVFVDAPPSLGVIARLNTACSAEIYIPCDSDERIYNGISADRAVFATYYSVIKANPAAANRNIVLFYKKLNALNNGIKAVQFAACLSVFLELGFIDMKDGKLTVNEGVRRPLGDSRLYARLSGGK